MRRIILTLLTIASLIPLFFAAPACAQATRTWVSGVGDDANPCSRTAPCKTFAGAISKTAAAGEIDCLDPGGFGALTITKSITIDCSETVGSVLVSGTNGIVISAANTDKVILRNIRVQGINTGLAGIKILAAAAVSIENCVATEFTQQGILDVRSVAGSKLYVRNTITSHNTGNGISIAATAANQAVIENTMSIGNAASGLGVASLNNVMVTRSVLSGNAGNGIVTDAGSVVNVDSSQITSNGTGISSGGTVRMSNSDVTLNATGFSGTTTSYGNNRLQGNTSFGTAVAAAGGAVNNLGEQ